MKWTKRDASWALALECGQGERWHPHARIYSVKEVHFDSPDSKTYKYVALIWPECHSDVRHVQIGYNTINEAKRDVNSAFTT